jgi:lipopolysaccharide export system permease protein
VILSRYLTREVLGSLLAVTFILLLIFLSNQLVRYLGYAAVGKLAPNILLQLLGFEVPYLLALLLPLGLYLGIILTYGRLHTDNEMSVMLSCGLSEKRLMKITGVLTGAITLILIILTLVINPWIASKKQVALAEGMSTENVLANLMPGRFQVTSNGKRVVYVEKISRENKTADKLFFADQMKPSSSEAAPAVWAVVSAEKGYQSVDKPTDQHFLVAESGYRYEGVPGQDDYKIIQFKKYAVKIPDVTMGALHHHETEALPTTKLLQEYYDPYNAAEFQWRLSIPISAFLLALLAVPLSHVKPRQGRYSALLPAVLMYVLYVNFLFVARNWVEQKSLSLSIGLWGVHIFFLCIVVGVLSYQSTTIKKLLRRI